jgi:translocation and assembly module TamB
LPLAVNIERLVVDELALGASLPGGPARFRIEGAARLGDFRKGLSLDLSAARTDGSPGSFTAQLSYLPGTEQLTTALRLDDGGFLAGLLGLPALPAVAIQLSGGGYLDDWRGELGFDGGADLELQSKVSITGEDAGRRVVLNAKGRLAALADDALRPLLDTETSLDASILLRSDELLLVDRFELGGGFGTASLSGELDLRGDAADVTAMLAPAGPDRFAKLTSGASWGALRLSATATGSVLEPSLAVSLTGERVAHGDLAVRSIVADLDAALFGRLTDPAARIEVAAELTLEGLDFAADLPPALLEPRVQLSVRGSAAPSGNIVIDSLAMDAPVARLLAEGAGEGWGVESAALVGTLDVPDLSRLETLADGPLAGGAVVGLKVEWNGTKAALRGRATLEGLSTGMATVDGLLGDAPRLAVAASVGTAGVIDVEGLLLRGLGVELWASGTVGAGALGIDWLSAADLAAVDPSLDGYLTAAGRLTGSPEDPAVQARLAVIDARLAGYPVSEAELDATITGLTTRPLGDLAMEGIVAGLPARGLARLRVENTGAVRIDPLALEMASLVAAGTVTLDAGAASGALSASIGSLAELAPFIGESLSGEADANASLSVRDGRQMVDALVSGSGIGITGMASAGRTELALHLSDLLAMPGIAARLNAEEILAGALALDRATVTADGDLGTVALSIDLSGEPFSANAQADLVLSDDETRIEIAALSARYADVRAALAGPGKVALAPGSVLVDGLVLQAEGGRLSASGQYGDASDLEVALTDVPLALARLAVPDLELTGRVNGGLRLTGTRSAPRASGELTASGVTLGALRAAGVPDLDVSAALDWNGASLNLGSAVSGDFGGPLSASATLSAPPDPATGLPAVDTGSSLTGRLSGTARLAVLNDLLAARGDCIGGTAAVDLTHAGSFSAPRVGGSLGVTGGSWHSPMAGVALDDIRLRLNGDGDRLSIVELTAKAPNGGTLGGGGSIGIDPGSGFPADISVRFEDALMIDSDIVSAKISGEAGIAGALAGSLDLVGRLSVVEAEIRLPERLPPSIHTLEVVEINVPPELEARGPVSTAGGTSNAPPLPVSLDLAIDSPGRIFVRGRGLEAEVAGEVRVSGRIGASEVSGGFELRRGHLELLGRRFNFDEGIVTLPEDGGVDADIRFVTRTDLDDASAQITVSGRASAPQITVESSPQLPQDEILGRVLFGRRTGSLSALESIQLARSALELTGVGTGPDLLGGVRDRLGLDRLGVRQSEGEQRGSSLNLRGRIAERIDLGLQQGLQAGSGRATVDLARLRLFGAILRRNRPCSARRVLIWLRRGLRNCL